MKPALIFNQYIWIINTFKTYGKLTLAQLDQKWREAKVAEGMMSRDCPLASRTYPQSVVLFKINM